MKQRSVTSNIIYSVISQIAGIIAPLIISPYISRVFNANLIGDYGYTLANSSYFVLVEGLGLTLYGMLKVAQVRDDREKLSRLFWEIFWLKMILMIMCTVVYVILFVANGEEKLRSLYLIMTLNIVANGIDVTWLLSGLEEFRTVAIRTVFVRIVSVVLILLCVKTENDLHTYAWIMQASALVSYITVIPIALNRVKWVKVRELHIIKHIGPSFVYCIPGLVNTVFSSADKSVLGAFSRNSYEVGVYDQANKVCQLCAGSINAISNAVLPRAAYLYKNAKNDEDAKKFVIGTIQFALMISIPICIGIASISDAFIPWFFGPGYDKSILLLKILSINVVFTSVGNFISQQCLIARGQQKEYNIAITIGALLNILMNLLLVNKHMSVGVSVASAISGFIVFALVLFQAKRVIKIYDIMKLAWKYIVSATVMAIVVSICRIDANLFTQLIIKVLLGMISYCFILYLLKDDGFKSIIKKETIRK